MRAIKKTQLSSNELRVGNWVKRDTQPDGFQIDERSFTKLDDYEYLPISLTEEWFIKFKAIEKKVPGCVSEWQICINNFELNWDSDTGLVLFIENSNETISLNHVKCVHQLQNLYFALTGKELAI